ncbi:hypothetical protein POX_f07710 [Penicillium oxalicum]|uniref:hypothetical protein n=1 Tax=Penicillium oxalicum TaxID=69781 RepID=UPI0020B7654A|nr:hypothetical protein POX_f07710 [Penicillium oxalicum]KAI2787347.1 hypothetical protein POX_f07710 [Penicillium oxalicum]
MLHDSCGINNHNRTNAGVSSPADSAGMEQWMLKQSINLPARPARLAYDKVPRLSWLNNQDHSC